MRITIITLAVVSLSAGARPSWAPPQEANFVQSTYLSGVGAITGMAWAPDGSNRLFLITKGNDDPDPPTPGTIRVAVNGALQATPFASFVPDRVDGTHDLFTNSECGVIGICLDPDYGTNGFVYVFVTTSNTTQRIYRFTAGTDGSGNLVGGSRVQIGIDLPTLGNNHDGGGIGISPADGHLYWAIGNLGNGANAGGNPDRNSLASKVGRMNRTTGDPIADNPYNTDGTRTAKNYIWASGFRNPFTLAFHPVTNALWVNVVGEQYEQAFLVTRDSDAGYTNSGASTPPYGENRTTATAPVLVPRISYRTNVSPFGGCITGGTFNFGTQFPDSHRGNFFFGDYNSGKIMRAQLNGAGDAVTTITEFVTGVGSVVDCEMGPDGALYYANLSGTVYRLAYSGTSTQGIIATPGTVAVTEGASSGLNIRLAADPGASGRTVTLARTSGSGDVTLSQSTLNFSSANWSTGIDVDVMAAEDADAVDEGATITCTSTGLSPLNVAVNVDDNDTLSTAPTAVISRPLNGEVISGATSEFYGNGTDDVGTVKADFYVDGVLESTDTTPGGHYHFGGDHLLFDTTKYADGVHVLRMTVTDGDGETGSHEISVTILNNRPVFQQDPGADKLIVMEAENAVEALIQGGHEWQPDASYPGYSGASAMRAMPDSGANVNTGFAAGSPKLSFLANFVQTGTYTVWVRGRGPGGAGSDDSVHVGLDGAESATADRISTFGTDWTWSNATMDAAPATLLVATPGIHSVDVWMREDGFVIDKLLLTINAALPAPAGTGPAESAKTGGPSSGGDGGGGGSGGGGCGALGAEALIVVLLLRRRRTV
jgi:glucose/arabinose dehydrogenase